MDAFSEILSGVKLNGAVFFSAEFSSPWGFTTPASEKIAAELAPGLPTSCFTISLSTAGHWQGWWMDHPWNSIRVTSSFFPMGIRTT